MVLRSGQPIDGREVEQATSAWPPERFASLCDALAWAASGRACASLPSFTARVNAKDGGIDAEWAVEIPKDGQVISTPILEPGWNVFQYKKRDLIAQDRRRVIATLKSSLSGAVDNLVKKEERVPDRYVLFVNVDLTHRDKQVLKEAILKSFSSQNGCSLHVEIVGAAELAALLNDFPHLRAAYFADLSFKAWAVAYEDHKERKRFIASVDLIGREEDLKRLRSLVDDPQVRVVVVTGPHAMGKSRLVLEATRHRPHDVVLALDPRSLDARDYRSLSGDHGEMVCIVEDPEPDSVRSLIDEALTAPHCKLLLTLPTSTSAIEPSYGRDDRVQTHRLGPLSEEHARALLRAVGRPLAYEIEDWILRHAGGIPGVILAAASVDLRADLTNFAHAVGREFESRIERELGVEALRCARLLSLLTHVGVRGRKEEELRLLCELFGEGLSVHGVVLLVEKLERAGVVKIGGSFAHITIPLLASHLAAQALRGRSLDETLALFGRLTESGRVRLLERLSEIKSEEVEQLWKAMFDADGPFGNFQRALAQAQVLRFVVGAVPERVLRVLEGGLQDMTREARFAITGELRRGLMWTLEQLLFRAKTSARAIRLLWLLAEAENETCGNNATGVLAECFHPLHPQMPLPLWERLALLRELLSEGMSEQGKLLAVRALGEAVSTRGRLAFLRRGHGLVPFDSRPVLTYGEIASYCRSLLDILMNFAKGPDPVATAALAILPSAVEGFGSSADAQGALACFQTLVDWAREGRLGLQVSMLSGSLRLLQDTLSSCVEAPDFPVDRREEFVGYATRAEHLRIELENGSFATRLRRWAGSWVYEAVDDPPEEWLERFERELARLAEEAARTPDLLDANLMNWLFSSEAERAETFFLHLGRCDLAAVFRKAVEELGKMSEKARAFAMYWRGWAEREPSLAEQRLDELVHAHRVLGTAIVQASVVFAPTPRAVERVENQLRDERVEPRQVYWALFASRWMKELDEDQFERILHLLAGQTLEFARVAILVLRQWIHHGRRLHRSLADFAWRCLEHCSPLEDRNDSWVFDFLAAHLAQVDVERGFSFLQASLLKAEKDWNSWNPLNRSNSKKFWEVLYAQDRSRLIKVLLDVVQRDLLYEFQLAWNLKELIDQEKDKELLLSYASCSVENARSIASWATNARPGFWPLAFRLVQLYPHDEQMLDNLVAGIQQEGSMREGPRSRFHERLVLEIKTKLDDPLTPPEVRPWLREVLSRLEREIPHHMVWEYDIDVDALRHHIGDKGSTQRMWAIGRVLKYAAWEDIKRLLTVEDIEEALPQVDLPERKRKTLERALRVWRYDK